MEPTGIVDKKVALTACVCASFIIASAMLIVFYGGGQEDRDLRLIGRVNTGGSGIYLSADENVSEYVDTSKGGLDFTNTGKNWGGKIFGTPGITSVQHLLLQDLVENKIKLEFKHYTEGQSLDENTVYYIFPITDAVKFESSAEQEDLKGKLVGGIIWEPQFSRLIEDGCKQVALTSQIYPEHICCVIGASHNFITGNGDLTVRFLAAYAETVKKINAAKNDLDSDDYAELVDIAKKQTGMDDGINKIIKKALSNVCYTATDSSYSGEGSPLADLQEDVEELAESYQKMGRLKRSLADSGFSSDRRFARIFVDDGYFCQALNFVPDPNEYSARDTVSVACISGDMHSLAVTYGTKLGIFADYGIDITQSYAANGDGVVVSLQNGKADIGFMGASPIMITAINSGLVTA